jgi:hypothetical protein
LIEETYQEKFTDFPYILRHSQALVSFKKYMPPPLPYFKVNIFPSPLCLNIFCLFVILSLTQLYCYTPEIFLFSTATFKYTYRAPLRRIGQEVSERELVKISVIETDTATSGLHWIFHMHSEFSRPAMCNNAT